MTALRTILTFSLTAVAALAANTTPKRVGIVCDHNRAQNVIESVAELLGPGYQVVVVDAHGRDHRGVLPTMLSEKKVDFVVALEKDPVFWNGSQEVRLLSNRLAAKSIPVVGLERVHQIAKAQGTLPNPNATDNVQPK